MRFDRANGCSIRKAGREWLGMPGAIHGPKQKLRKARRHHGERLVCAVLELPAKHHVRPRAVERYKPRYSIEARRRSAIRAPEAWRSRIKSPLGRQAVPRSLALQLPKYPVAAHLESAWIEQFDDPFVGRVAPRGLASYRASDRASGDPDLLRYIIVAQGGSIYKQAAHRWLTRLETHHFLNRPPAVTTARAAFCCAVHGCRPTRFTACARRWSPTSEHPLGQFNRGVTIEVRRNGAIVPCRGFADRLPYGNEVAMVKRWAKDHRLVWQALERDGRELVKTRHRLFLSI